MANVFISYARENAASAKRLAEALNRSGHSSWWDRDVPVGTSFDDVIATKIQACKCMLVLWSTASTTSHWVREEAMEGRERQILVPVLIEAVRPPLGFRRIQCASLVNWNGRPDHTDYVRLLSSIERLTRHALDPITPDPRTGHKMLEPAPRHRWEELIVKYAIDECERKTGMDLSSDHLAMARLSEAAAKAANELDAVAETDVNLPYITANKTGFYHLTLKVSHAVLALRLLAEGIQNPIRIR